MPPILNANAIITCSHGGTFKIAPTKAAMHSVGGAPPLTVADVAAGSMPVSPCPFATPAGPAPCIKLASATGGFSMKTTFGGAPALLQSTQFLTVPGGAGAPVPAMVTSPGQATVQST